MTAEQIIKEIEALPKSERERLVQQMRELGSDEIPRDFIDARGRRSKAIRSILRSERTKSMSSRLRPGTRFRA